MREPRGSVSLRMWCTTAVIGHHTFRPAMAKAAICAAEEKNPPGGKRPPWASILADKLF